MSDPVSIAKQKLAKGKAKLEERATSSAPPADAEHLEFEYASEVVMEKKEWLWRHHLLIGALEILTGASTIGKGQTHVQFVKCVTTGSEWPDGQPGCEPGYVIMLGSEDMKSQELKPRLVAAGVDCGKVVFLKGIRKDKKNRMFLLEEDIDKLERLVIRLRDEGKAVKLITIDPITNYVGSGKKMNNSQNTDVRGQLMPLVEMLERQKCACSVITHPAKGAGANSQDHYNGAGAYIQVPRVGHMCIKEYDADNAETGRALFTMVATNAGKKQKSIAYTISTRHVIGDDPEKDVHPFIVWQGQVDISADEAIYRQKQHFRGGKEDDSMRDAVANFIVGRLRDGPALADSIVKDCMKTFGVSNSTVWRVSKKLSVITRKGKEVDGKWTWSHPEFPGQAEMRLGKNAREHM